ncbi:MAG: hypothetical protein ABI467_00785 [Kofleriaceae bacterium]
MDTKQPNQGEGDRVSARRYNHDLREFIAEGRVEPAALDAERFVEAHPDEAMRAERKAKHGPMGWLARTVESLRAVLHRT